MKGKVPGRLHQAEPALGVVELVNDGEGVILVRGHHMELGGRRPLEGHEDRQDRAIVVDQGDPEDGEREGEGGGIDAGAGPTEVRAGAVQGGAEDQHGEEEEDVVGGEEHGAVGRETPWIKVAGGSGLVLFRPVGPPKPGLAYSGRPGGTDP